MPQVDFAYELADRFVALERGRVVLDGARDEISRDDIYRKVTV